MLLSLPGTAQELPPAGGWPLRPVTALRVAAEPPGGLVAYRQGQRWGYADTTGRVWIQPIFPTEPPSFGAGLLLVPQAALASGASARPAAPAPSRQQRIPGRSRLHRFLRLWREFTIQPEANPPAWNRRYGTLWTDTNGTNWVPGRTGSHPQEPVCLLNVRGEQLTARPDEALVAGPDGAWRALWRPAGAPAQRELVAIGASTPPRANVPAAPGQLLTTLVRAPGPMVPRRLLRYRTFDLNGHFDRFAFSSTATAAPRFMVRHLNWLRPRRLVEVNGGCGYQALEEERRYRHGGRQALFDGQGRRLTGYRYAGALVVLPRRLAYWHWSDSLYYDQSAADSSGLPLQWLIAEATNGPARRYGLLDLQGRELTPPLFARLQAVGPNALWVVAVRHGRLYYGLLDTLGRYHLPLSPRPLSLPDAAGLLRYRSTPPHRLTHRRSYSSNDTQYPDTATVQYLRPDGRPAFAGRFSQAGPFWQGRALVRQGHNYGLIDTLGRWVLPPQPEELSYYAFDGRHHAQQEATDPLKIFDRFFGPGQSDNSYWSSVPGDSLLLLTRGPQGYGLRSGLTGRVVIPAIFDKRPEQWLGAVVGERSAHPLGLTPQGQAFAPDQSASYPPGVRRQTRCRPDAPCLTSATDFSHPLLKRTTQGWRTRGGRQLWQD